MMRKTFNLMGCLVVLTASAAFAADEDDAELVEKVAVRNRLFSVENRWELGANVGFQLLTRFTDHYNFNLSGAYNIKDWIALELRAGYAVSQHTSLADRVQVDSDRAIANSKASDATNLWEMNGNALFGVRFQPIYGKINLLAELPVHFQFYLWAGGGAAMLKQQSLVICLTPQGPGCGEFFVDNKVSPLVSLALGFRFFVANHHSVKLEARSYSYLDSYWTGVPIRSAASGSMTRGTAFSYPDRERLAASGAVEAQSGITSMVQLDLGYTFIF